MVNLLRYIWKKITPAKKNYTGTARGARDKYQVCVYMVYLGILSLLICHEQFQYFSQVFYSNLGGSSARGGCAVKDKVLTLDGRLP